MALAFDLACRGAGVPYALVGGMAVLAWGRPRATMDVDALLLLEPSRVSAFVSALRGENLAVSAADLNAALADQSHVTVFDEEDSQNLVHIDVKLVATPEEREQVDAAREVPLAGARLRVARPEDGIAYKLKFGSPLDLDDARSILIRQREHLDLTRLRRFARRLGVEPALERLLREL